MVVGVCHIDLVIHGNRSLKGKRKVIKSIKERVKGRFNVSVAEVDDHELWQRSKLGISAVGKDNSYVNSLLERVLNFIESMSLAEIVHSDIEIVYY